MLRMHAPYLLLEIVDDARKPQTGKGADVQETYFGFHYKPLSKQLIDVHVIL